MGFEEGYLCSNEEFVTGCAKALEDLENWLCSGNPFRLKLFWHNCGYTCK